MTCITSSKFRRCCSFLLAVGPFIGGCLPTKQSSSDVVRRVEAESAQHVADAFLKAFKNRNWGAIYGLSSPSERRANKISKEEFVAIMSAVSADTRDIFSRATCLPLSSQRSDNRYYLIDFGVKSGAKDISGSAPGFVLVVHARDEKWWGLVVPVIGAVNLYTPGAPEQRWLKLAEAMEQNDVSKLVLIDSRTEITVGRLRQAADGKISPDFISVSSGLSTEATGQPSKG